MLGARTAEFARGENGGSRLVLRESEGKRGRFAIRKWRPKRLYLKMYRYDFCKLEILDDGVLYVIVASVISGVIIRDICLR